MYHAGMTLTTPQMSSTLAAKAREYLRVSADRSGRQASVSEQHQDNQRAATDQGLTLGEPYAERQAVSASRYSTKVRGGYDELIADLRRGTFGADVLVMWESSRGSRRVGEWATLLDLLEDNGVRVLVTTHGRVYDPSNGRDRRSMLEDAVDSEYESSKISARVTRAMAEQAAQGRPHGTCPVGYRRVFDPNTGRLLNWEPDPEAAPIVRELFQRLRKGDSFRAIGKDFESRGIVNGKGTPFHPAHLRSIAVKAVYAGLRPHKGETVEGTWEPIVDKALFFDVQRLITSPERRTSRSGRAVHDLTMIIRCDVCSGALIVTNRSDGRQPGRPRYQCQNGHVRIEKAGVDRIVVGDETGLGVLLSYLARQDVYESLAAAQVDSAEVSRLDDEIAQARLDLAEAENATPATIAEARMFSRTIEGLTERLNGLEGRRRELTVPAPLAAFLADREGDVLTRWKATPISARREIAKILLTPEMLGEVRITPSPRPGLLVEAVERITWRRAT